MIIIRLIAVLSLTLSLIGCTSTPEPQWVPASADIEEKEQKPVMIVPSPPEKPKPPRSEDKRDIVKEAYERHMKQREMDQKANQEWWDLVQKHKQEILESKQQHEKEMKTSNN